MGAHRKPKSKPTAFAAVVTAAIVVPTGTAAAASYGALGSSSGGVGAASAGLLAKKAQSAAMYVAHSATRHATLVSAPIAVPSASASTGAKASASASASASAAKASAGAGSGASSTKSATATASPSPTKADPYANVTIASLEPTGLYGSQQYFTPNSAQWANAKAIVAVTKQRGMSLYASVIAVATAMQESSLINLTSATNYDSLGLFQQRPSMGWGTASQLTDPVYATNAFLAALTTYAPNYQSQSLWSSAQAVQRSGFPTAYAQWQDQAARMVQSIIKGSA